MYCFFFFCLIRFYFFFVVVLFCFVNCVLLLLFLLLLLYFVQGGDTPLDLLYRKRSENWKEDIKVGKLLEQHGAVYKSVTEDQRDLVSNKKYFDQFVVEHPYIGHIPIHNAMTTADIDGKINNNTHMHDCDVDGLIAILKSILLDSKYFYDEKICHIVDISCLSIFCEYHASF